MLVKWSFLDGRHVISTMGPLAIHQGIFLRDGQIVHNFMTQLRGASTLLWIYSSDLRSASSSVVCQSHLDIFSIVKNHVVLSQCAWLDSKCD